MNKGIRRNNSIVPAGTLVLVVLSFAQEALAQPWPGNPPQPGPAPGEPVRTLHTPLLDGAPSEPPFVPPPKGQPPPIGDGPTPAPVNPGMPGPPTLLPWVPAIPANQIDQANSGVNLPVTPAVISPPGVLGPSLSGVVPPPPSTPGPDPGTLPGPMDFTQPPAAVVHINPNGGMPGDFAPRHRWGAQTTRDFGRSPNDVYGPGSQLTDFGELLPNKPDLAKQPQFSQDGPRKCQYIQKRGSNNRDPNLAHAQETQDLNGNRTLFKGENLRAKFTIAPY